MKILHLPLLTALALPAVVNADHDQNHNDQSKCTITSEYNSDYRIEMYWRAQGLLFYKRKPKYSVFFPMSNGYGSDYATIKEWYNSSSGYSPKWKDSYKDGDAMRGRTGEVVVFVGDIPYFAYLQMSIKQKKKIKYEGEGRVLFIDMGQTFHYLRSSKERAELYAERDGEWFKVAHNFWRLGKDCKITIPKYFL